MDDHICELNLIGTQDILKQCDSRKDFKKILKYSWNTSEENTVVKIVSDGVKTLTRDIFQFKRLDYLFLSKDVTPLISSHHCSVIAELTEKKQIKPKINNIPSQSANKHSAGKDEEFFATCVERDDDAQPEESQNVQPDAEPAEELITKEYKFFLKDLSTNGSYIKRNNDSKNIIKLKKNEIVELVDNDIIGLVRDKANGDLVIGYKFTIKK